MFGIFIGWLSLITYIVYSVGFIFGSILMSYENHKTLNISDILVVSILYYKINYNNHCFYYRLFSSLHKSMTLLSFIGPFIQSFSEARGAAAPMFQLIDEVN